MNEILVYGDIGWEVTTRGVAEQLRDADGGDVTVRINSPGGDVYEGLGIMNALRAHPGTVTAVIEGLAASAASFIAVGGADRIVARPNAELMIHDAWTFADGNAAELEKTVIDLNRLSDNLAAIYAERVGGDAVQWREIMRAETWFSAREALDAGLIDAVEDARQPVAASKRPLVFAQARAKFKYSGRASAPDPGVVVARSVSGAIPSSKPNSGQEGTIMDIFSQLAQHYGKSPEDVEYALSGFFNEQTAEVPAVITVSYPDEATVVPTGRTVVEPTTEVPEGLTFAVTAVTEGWTAEVNETSGAVTVVSADGSKIGDTGEVTLSVAGSGGEAEFMLAVTVVTADEKANEPDPAAAGEEPAPVDDPGMDNVVVPRAFYEELTRAYALNKERMEELAKREREEEVDGWIAAGKFSAGLRMKALADMENSPEMARRVWGGLPDGTIPRGEKGYSKAAVKDSVTTGGADKTKKNAAELIAHANEIASEGK